MSKTGIKHMNSKAKDKTKNLKGRGVIEIQSELNQFIVLNGANVNRNWCRQYVDSNHTS